LDWINALRGETVALDTAPLIYFIEENPSYFQVVRSFFLALDRQSFHAVTSTVTLLEVLVLPFRRKKSDLAQQYKEILLNNKSLTTISFTPEIAEYAARLRAERNFTPPDAIQIATAIRAQASYFLTNDINLSRIPNLKYLILADLVKSGNF
jgi:predicted nucleic acid-binding protein